MRILGLRPLRVSAALLLLAASVQLGVSARDHQAQQPPTFRSRVTLVPIAVRVLDAHGKPVTNLGKDDFTITEDGVPQHISHFLRQSLMAHPPDANPRPAGPPTETMELTPQDRRIFLIVLGPSARWLPDDAYGTVQAITRFLRERLLPQDYAGFLGWRNATDLTTEHEAVAQVVERLRAFQLALEHRRDFPRGFLPQYTVAARPLPPAIKAELDAVFEPATHLPRSAPLVAGRDLRLLLAQTEAQLDAIYKPEEYAPLRLARHYTATSDIYTALEYLRDVEGEKHLVLIEPGGVAFPAVEDDRNLARIASNARVVIDPICPATFNPWNSITTKNVAQLTGGQALLNQDPDRALAAIDEATRAGYLLGYYPANPTLDGRHRKLTVAAKRLSGATLLYRRSYQATLTPPRLDKQFIVQDRIMAAGDYTGDIRDVPLTLKGSAKPGVVAAEVLIDLSHIDLQDDADRHVGKVEVAFFCLDSMERLVGQAWQTIDLRLKEETYRRLLTEGLRHAAEIPTKGSARYLKAVAYDYRSNRLGSTVAKVR